MENIPSTLITDYTLSAVILMGYINVWRAWANDRKTNQRLIAALIRRIGEVADALGAKSPHDAISSELEKDHGHND